MATWKKVLLEGDVDLTGDLVTGNQKDLNTPAGSGLKGGSAGGVFTGNNVLLGTGDLDLSVDIIGTLGTSTIDGDADYVLIHDASVNGGEGGLRKALIADLATEFTSDVGSVRLVGDTGQTLLADDNVLFQFVGGVGLTTQALGTVDASINAQATGGDGRVIINANDAGTIAPGSLNADIEAVKGVVALDSDHFEVGTFDLTSIKDGAIDTDELANGAVDNSKVAANAGIVDSKLATIGTTGKVDVNAIDIDGAPQAQTIDLNSGDYLLFHDNSSTLGSGDGHNYTATIGQLQAFIGSTISVSAANAHSGIEGPIEGGGTEEGGVLTYIDKLTFDAFGHVTDVETDTIPNASTAATGVVTADDQSFGGIKTFEEIRIDDSGDGNGNLTVDGNATITGNLTVQGDTTTLNVETLNVEDSSIVGSVPASPYATDSNGANLAQGAASGGGFFLNSHHGTNIAKFAGFEWKDNGNLTGWACRDTADATSNASATTFPLAVIQFSTATPTSGTDAAGVGSFYFESDAQDLYFRVD